MTSFSPRTRNSKFSSPAKIGTSKNVSTCSQSCTRRSKHRQIPKYRLLSKLKKTILLTCRPIAISWKKYQQSTCFARGIHFGLYEIPNLQQARCCLVFRVKDQRPLRRPAITYIQHTTPIIVQEACLSRDSHLGHCRWMLQRFKLLRYHNPSTRPVNIHQRFQIIYQICAWKLGRKGFFTTDEF